MSNAFKYFFPIVLTPVLTVVAITLTNDKTNAVQDKQINFTNNRIDNVVSELHVATTKLHSLEVTEAIERTKLIRVQNTLNSMESKLDDIRGQMYERRRYSKTGHTGDADT
nr:hypothetical protein BCU03_09525 [Vibrio breoganii]